MSLALNLGTKPDGLVIKTLGLDDIIILGDYEISMKDFFLAAEYVLANSDLMPDDPRLQFVKCVQAMRETDGWNPGGKRLESPLPPILPENRK